MASARYSCSSTMIRARWWGKVMGPMDSFKSARCLTLGAMPKEEPMRKQALLLPEFFTVFKVFAKSSLDNSFPSGVKAQNQAPLGSLEKIKSASFSSPAEISAGEGFSGSRASGSSRRVNLQ